jgi:hypothetical protein
MVPDWKAVETHLTVVIRECSERYLEGFRLRYDAWARGDIELAELCVEAGDTFDAYAAETLAAALAIATTPSQPTALAAWVHERYLDGIATLGEAIRDEASDPDVRHALAQTLQHRVIRAELRLLDPAQSARPAGRDAPGLDDGSEIELEPDTDDPKTHDPEG